MLRTAASSTACLCVLALSACTEPPPPAAAPPPAPAVPPKSSPPKTKAMTLPLKADQTCSYTLKDVRTESLGDQLAAGHEATVQYDLRTQLTATGTLAYVLKVKHVSLNGKREAYQVKLDSSDHGQMVRARGGADTLLMFDAVLYLALLDQELTFEVHPSGKLLRVKGAVAAREAYLAMHPPKPRKAPHQIARVAVAMSDDNLARRFLPLAALAPAKDKLQPLTTSGTKAAFDFAEYAADSLTAVRVRWVKDQLILEEKRAFAPSPREPKYAPHTGFPKVELRSAKAQATIALDPASPCFVKAATQYSVNRSWTGMLEEKEVTTEQKVTGTWLVDAAQPRTP